MGRPGSLTVDRERHPQVTLRAARDEDSASLLAWRNDADAVRFSISGRAVTVEEHQRWFSGIVDDPERTRLWIAEQHDEPVGQVRIDIDAGIGTVSIAVDPGHRGRGVGTAMLRALTASVHTGDAPRQLVALVRSDNPASLHAFEAAAFHRVAGGVGDFLRLEWP
jgi:RimJ/RimL family protein N-acetyltransferase